MVKVSVIVPVYNVEKYLKDSIESLQNQTLKDLEIILVNDGSTDGSLSICRSYSAADGRIRVIDKPNGGVSSARNAGMEAASGEYLGFIDPDDWVEPGMYESMCRKAEGIGAEACICNYVRNTGGSVLQVPLGIEGDLLGREAIADELLAGIIACPDLNSGAAPILGSVCRCIFRRELAAENSLRFLEGIPFMEDALFCLRAFSKCGRVAVDGAYHYNYRIVQRSATTSYKKDFLRLQREVFGAMRRILAEEKLEERLRGRLDIRYVNMDFDIIANEVHRDNPKALGEKLKAIRELCRDSELRRILGSLDTVGYTFRKRFILNALKKGSAAAIYIYYSVITRLL